MTFTVTHRRGQMEEGSDTTDFAGLLAELDVADAEHGDVAVEDESGWSLTAHRNGNVTFENVDEDGDPRHMRNVPRDKVLDLMRLVAAGDIEAVSREDWQPEYPR